MVRKVFRLKRSQAKKAELDRADAREVEWKVRRPMPMHYERFEELGDLLTKKEKYIAFRKALRSLNRKDRKKASALWDDLSLMMELGRFKRKDARSFLWCEAPDALKKAMVNEGRKILQKRLGRLKK